MKDFNQDTFTRDIDFPDGSTVCVEFTATYAPSGFQHAFGFQRELELVDVNFNAEGLTLEQSAHVQTLIENEEINPQRP